MPEQHHELIQEFFAAFSAFPEKSDPATQNELVHKILAAKGRNTWTRGRKVPATNVERFDLECDEQGDRHYLIAMDVNGKREHHRTVSLLTIDPQSTGIVINPGMPSVAEFLTALNTDGVAAQPQMICDAETLHVSGAQREQLSSILWNYISAHRDDTQSDVLTAVGSAIRKYIAMLDVSRMNEVASLLEAGHRAPLSLELELEVVKMIYRKFEANPPADTNTEAALSARLWEMAQDYMRPRFILREKYATVASLAVEAIVASRGSEAGDAVAAALTSRFAWFREMVTDDLVRLADRWRQKRPEAADWCEAIVRDVHPILGGEAHAGSAHH